MLLLDSGTRWCTAQHYDTPSKCSRTPKPNVSRIMKEMRGGNWHWGSGSERWQPRLLHYSFLLDVELGMHRLMPYTL